MKPGPPRDVDAYMAGLPEASRETLEPVRNAIRAAAPEAVEGIGYGMPQYKYRGRPLIYFAAAKAHCALYGTPEGNIRFPIGKTPRPALIRRLVRARMKEIDAAAGVRKTKRR